jgi:AcrR family transcriptional regulator
VNTEAAPGLRERKKQATRDALSWAALRLAVERGFANVLVEDIAAAAGVSPRTFNNYFSSKQEAICSRMLDRTERAAAALRARPADEPLWDALIAALTGPYQGSRVPDKAWVEGVRLVLATPELWGEYLKMSTVMERSLRDAVAERTGTDPERDLYPHLVATVVTAATGVATDQWLKIDPPVPLEPLLRDALRQIAAGLPTP